MKDETTRVLRRLGRLKASAKLKAAVLSSVISIQARQLGAQKGGRLLPMARGRHVVELEPIGFAALPRHARPAVERHFQFGGLSHEPEAFAA